MYACMCVCDGWQKRMCVLVTCRTCQPLLTCLIRLSSHYYPLATAYQKYVVKHKSAKLLITYAVGKLEAAPNISRLILSTSSQRVS